MRRILLAAIGAAVIVAVTGCTPASDGPTTSEVTTTAPTTTSPGPATTSTVAASTTTIETSGDGAVGSGCSPGSDILPDGLWYGAVADYSEGSVLFDLACFFRGEAAIKAAAEDGEESPPPNDYYVRNDNDTLRDLVVDPETNVTWYLDGDPASETDGRFSEWVELLNTRGFFFGIWVTIENGEVVSILEQWVP